MSRNGQRIVVVVRGRQAAFTLLEVVVGLALSLVLVAAVAAFQSYQLTTLRTQSEQIDLQGTARSVVDLIAREVRKTGRNPECQPAIGGLAEAKTNSMRLQTDLDGNGLISGANEDVTYGWSNALDAIVRVDHSQTSRSGILIDNVDLDGSAFHYFDGNGNELDASGTGLDLAQRRAVRRIRLDLVMTDADAGAGSTPATVRTSTNLDLRNRFFVDVNRSCDPPQGPAPTQPDEQPTPTLTPLVADNTPLPSPTCIPKNAGCADSTSCCSGNCKNGKCSP